MALTSLRSPVAGGSGAPRRRRLAGVLLPFGLCGGLLAAAGCSPFSLDGAWEGSASCSSTGTHTISALFDERADLTLRGHMYIENIRFFGAELTLRANLDNGRYNERRDEWEFDLQTDDTPAREFAVAMFYDRGDPDRLAGDIDQFDGNGRVSQTCEMRLRRLSLPDN